MGNQINLHYQQMTLKLERKSVLSSLAVLKKTFGYDQFREGQAELVGAIMEKQDALGIMPTGAGKSICFQVPALELEGVTLVVSPLISLMSDQVQALIQADVKAAYLNSSLSANQYRTVLKNIRNNQYKIIYVAPERLLTDSFLDLANQITISMITIDEAHCLSQWGQDFRPSYLKVVDFIETLPVRPIISAFTATATAHVRDDIIEKLQLEDPFILTTGFDRTNLSFAVKKPKSKMDALEEFLELHEGKSGIVYCSTRKNVEQVYQNLLDQGYAAARYHAGLPDEERENSQTDFLYDRKRIMVATNAFGMGIDKSNVSFVVHYNMPKNIENYYQEAGRAGRDGEPAECLLLYSGQDVITNQFLIDNSNDNDEIDPITQKAIRAKDRELLKQMTFYCHTMDCLRAYILRYFGDTTGNYCGNCSNCNDHFETVDVTVEAQKILSCVKRVNERFGIKVIVDTLRGKKNQRITSLHLDQQSTFGIMADVSESKIRDIINFLLLNEYLCTTSGEYPVVQLTEKSLIILFEKEPVSMKIVKEEERTKPRVARAGKTVHYENKELFTKLKSLRSQLAQEQNVPAFVVFSDATLHDICAKLPKNHLEFLEVSGVGHAKLTKYGDVFLEVVTAFLEENPV